jgi:hypothetical protein
MAKLYKEISSIPTPYTPGGIYVVRVGAGIDIYVANSTGTAIFKHNTNSTLTETFENFNRVGFLKFLQGSTNTYSNTYNSFTIGTAVAKVFNVNSLYGRKPGLEYNLPANGTTNTCGTRFGSNIFYCSSTPGMGGFTYNFEFGFSQGSNSTTKRFSFLFSNTLTFVTTANVTTYTNVPFFGLAYEVGDTVYSVVSSKGDGTAVLKIPTSISVETADRSDWFTGTVTNIPGSLDVSITFRKNTDNPVTVVLNNLTKLPATNIPLSPKFVVDDSVVTKLRGFCQGNITYKLG